MDSQHFGELSEANFRLAFSKIGIKLRETEFRLLKATLDERAIGFLKYPILVRELMGIPQQEFIHKDIKNVGRHIVETRDVNRGEFT